MTHRAETRYICDRCSEEEVVEMANSPVPMRTGGPENWLPLSTGRGETPLQHLCPTCTKEFHLFMGNHKHE
jgi:DNA-directed RNA polymerase subunit RPC12/RpoP